MSFGVERTRLPGEEYRDYIVLLVAILGGLIPETGSEERSVFVSAIMAPLLGGLIAFYYRFIPLSWKIFLAVIFSGGSFFMRSVTTWLALDFNFIDGSGVLQWPVRHFLLFASVLAPCAAVIPCHFIFLFTERKKLERKLKGR